MCAWTNPRTWTTGELVTDTMLNIHLRDNLNALRPYTNKGDIAKLDSSGQLARLGVGNETECLKTYGGDAVYKGAFGFSVRFKGDTIQSISHGINTTLVFDYTESDAYGFMTSSSVATIPAGWGGLYLFGAGGYFDGHASSGSLRQIGFNDAIWASFVQATSGIEIWVNICKLSSLSSGDTTFIRVLQHSGVSLNFKNAYFWGFKVM